MNITLFGKKDLSFRKFKFIGKINQYYRKRPRFVKKCCFLPMSRNMKQIPVS